MEFLVDAIEGGSTLMQACKPALEFASVTKVVHDWQQGSEEIKAMALTGFKKSREI